MNIKSIEKELQENIFGEKYLGENDIKMIDTAISYIKEIKKYADIIKSAKNPPKNIVDKFEKKNKEQQSVKAAKNLNSYVIKYQPIYNELFKLLNKYKALQKVYGPYSNNNMKYAILFDCPTIEERRGSAKFSTDEQILANLQKLKENVKKVVYKTSSDEEPVKSGGIADKLLNDPDIAKNYHPDTLKIILNNLKNAGMQFESMRFDFTIISEDLDLSSENDKKYQILKDLLISFANRDNSEEEIKKLMDKSNSQKIIDYINSKLKPENIDNSKNINDLLTNLKSQVTQGVRDKYKKAETLNTISDIEKVLNNVSDPTKPQSQPVAKPKKSASSIGKGE